jgi:N-dimethylarginine dimethylaminohydrolase
MGHWEHKADVASTARPIICGVLDEFSRLTRVVVKHPRDAFGDPSVIDAEWRALGFTAPPDFARALDEYDRFLALIGQGGASILSLPKDDGAGLDSLYARDASIVCDRGVILCAMGKPLRAGEPAAQAAAFADWGIPTVGRIEPPGTLEGGDVVWLDARTIAVGRGYRTNDEGVRQLRALLGDAIDSMIEVPLPHWRGPGDVFHLMSILSPVANDVAVVYSPLMPVPFRERLLARGITLIDVPDEEFDSMGANVLAIAPRHAVMVAGNPRTRGRLEKAGVQVDEYSGQEISLKGGGGPTCLTRPIARAS